MKILPFLLSLLLASAYVCADVYKWVDDKGQVHYQDHPRGSPQGKISIDGNTMEKGDTPEIKELNSKKLLKDMEKARKQREKDRHKKLAAQRKQDEKCLKLRSQIRKLEARMHKGYSEFSNDRPPGYQRQQAELADRKKYVSENCN